MRRGNIVFIFSIMTVVLSGCLDLKQEPTAGSASGTVTSPSTGTPVLPPNLTPNPIEVEIPMKAEMRSKGAIVPRMYMKQIFKDAFSATDFSSPVLRDTDLSLVMSTSVSNSIDNLIAYEPGSFGPACNTYSSYGSKDCGGDTVSNALAEFVPESSTVRQLNVSKTCEYILNSESVVIVSGAAVSFDRSIYAVAKNISDTDVYLTPVLYTNLINGYALAEMNPQIISKLFSLFYRSRDITPEELEIYVDFNEALKQKSPTTSNLDRWRAILLMMCESPGWTVL